MEVLEFDLLRITLVLEQLPGGTRPKQILGDKIMVGVSNIDVPVVLLVELRHALFDADGHDRAGNEDDSKRLGLER